MLIFVSLSGCRSIELIVEIRISDMEFMWVNADDGTYKGSVSGAMDSDGLKGFTKFLVHFLDFPHEHPAADQVMVGFIPACQSGDFWPRKLCKRMKIQSVYTATDQVKSSSHKSGVS